MNVFNPPDWFSSEVILRGRLQEVPYVASAKYGIYISNFEWKFLSMNETENAEILKNSNLMTESTTLTTMKPTAMAAETIFANRKWYAKNAFKIITSTSNAILVKFSLPVSLLASSVLGMMF